MIFPGSVQKIISTYKILGLVPLDKTLHVLIGAIVTIILRYRHISIVKILITLSVLELIKEFHDSFVLNASIVEESVDFICTLSYPLLLLFVIKVKNKYLD